MVQVWHDVIVFTSAIFAGPCEPGARTRLVLFSSHCLIQLSPLRVSGLVRVSVDFEVGMLTKFVSTLEPRKPGGVAGGGACQLLRGPYDPPNAQYDVLQPGNPAKKPDEAVPPTWKSLRLGGRSAPDFTLSKPRAATPTHKQRGSLLALHGRDVEWTNREVAERRFP
jgi:hypothetical protein